MINGIINVYKEAGYTSFDVVAKLRGIVGQKKIGHTGTLDPDAIGVLPVCLGKATKICDILVDTDKTYETTMLLGVTTDTQDISGNVLREDTVTCSEDKVTEAILHFVGAYSQIPPMYSAKKVNGKKLYELARDGISIERKPCDVVIYSIKVLEMKLPRVRMEVACSKGTYIRTLCNDIGEQLGCGATMEKLIRTKAGDFCIQDSKTLEEIEELMKNASLFDYCRTVDSMFPEYPSIYADKEYDRLVHNGNAIRPDQTTEKGMQYKTGQKIRLYDSMDTFIGIYEYKQEEERFKPLKIFLSE